MPERIIPSDRDWWPDYGWEHLQRYAFAIQFCRAGVGLDFGCGIGYGTEILARAGASQVAGVDVDAGIIAAARQRAHPPNVSFHEQLATALPGAEFDFAVMFEVIEHVPNPAAVLHELAGRLKPGALLVISAPNKLQFTGAAQPLGNEWHLSEPTHADLHAWLAVDFEVTGEFEQSEPGIEGLDYVVGTLQRSWLLRLERGLRRLIGRPLVLPRRPDILLRKTDIFPLILERRALCRQFVFVARRR